MKKEYIYSTIAVIICLFSFAKLLSGYDNIVEPLTYGVIGAIILATQVVRIVQKKKGHQLPSYSSKEHYAFLIGCATGLFLSLLFDVHNQSIDLPSRLIVEKLILIVGFIIYSTFIQKRKNNKENN